MKRERLLSALRHWCRRNDRPFRIDTVAGKGSHIKVYVGHKATIVKAGELSPLYVQLILKQLSLPKDAI
jgi:hypothetical protein